MKKNYVSHMSPKGQLQVDDTLRLEGTSNIFVLGAASRLGLGIPEAPEIAYLHAEFVANNLLRIIKKKKPLR